MNWQEKFYYRKKATLEIQSVTVCFGMFGLYGHLDVFFDGYKAAQNARKLDQGYHVTIGNYEVWKDLNYLARD